MELTDPPPLTQVKTTTAKSDFKKRIISRKVEFFLSQPPTRLEEMEQLGFMHPFLWWGDEEQNERMRQEEQGQTIFSLFSFLLSRSNSARGEAGPLAPVETIHVQVKL